MYGERIREIRLARGYTLDELSERMNSQVTKQAISKYETGKAQPRPKTLVALCRALGVKTSELMEEPSYSFEALQYRTRAPLRPRSMERVESSLRYSLERRLRLEDRIRPGRKTGLSAERQRVDDFPQAEKAAASVRDNWMLGTDPIGNLVDLLERRSIYVFEVPGDGDFDGLAAVARTESGEVRAVGIAENPDTDGDRQRFNLAHELGHVLLDPAPHLNEEAVANRFAGAFLVPPDLVFEEIGQRRKDVSLDELLALKKSWGVSIQCILHRLRDLDVISQEHYKWWWREIDSLGYRKVEPNRLPREESSWELRNIARAQTEGIMTREQAALYLDEVQGPRPVDSLDRRALMKMSLEDRRAVMREHAERSKEYYSQLSDEWIEGAIDES